jgi:hypothetical protein
MTAGLWVFVSVGKAAETDTLIIERTLASFGNAIAMSIAIDRFSPAGQILSQTSLDDIMMPSGLDASLGNFIAVSDKASNTITMYSRELIKQFRYDGSSPLERRRFSSPSAVAMTPAGECTLLDGQGRILRLHPQTLEVHFVTSLERYDRFVGKIVSYTIGRKGMYVLVSDSGLIGFSAPSSPSITQFAVSFEAGTVSRTGDDLIFITKDQRSFYLLNDNLQRQFVVKDLNDPMLSASVLGQTYYVLTSTALYLCSINVK